MAKQNLILKPLPINRAKWLTAVAVNTGIVNSSVLRDRETGLQCCLGFLARKEGCTIKDITGISVLDGLGDEGDARICKAFDIVNWYPEDFAEEDHVNNIQSLFREAMNINDNHNISNKEREKSIKSILKDLGYAVTFIGKYPKHLRD